MKVPFRQQASEYDCVPTSLINALSYLFHRTEIPPFVVHRIYKECLDHEFSRGTSSRAIQDLGFWLNHYKEKRFRKFAVEAKFISGRQAHLGRKSKIIRCINSNGVALICVHTSRDERHCILGFRSEGGWLHCYDPHPRSRRYINNEAVQFVEAAGRQEPNLIIRLDWLEKDFNKANDSDECKYVLGCHIDRECLLLNRIHKP